MWIAGNRYDVRELNGAFGDLGTLIPFVLGALVMLGLLMVLVGLGLADSVSILLRLFPAAVLGVILMFGGLELARGLLPSVATGSDRAVTLLTAEHGRRLPGGPRPLVHAPGQRTRTPARGRGSGPPRTWHSEA